jgi:hypothetical protein
MGSGGVALPFLTSALEGSEFTNDICAVFVKAEFSVHEIYSHLRNYGLAAIEIVILNYTPWLQSTSELYRPSDRSLSTKLVPTFADRECRVVSVTHPHGR